MAYKTPYYNDQKNDNTLINELSWAGGSFPYAGTSDITISTPTTWSDATGFKKVRKLTIDAGQTLTIAKSPFFIFAEEISFGNTSSIIDASGSAGASSGSFTGYTANGGTAVDGSARAQAGCGGGMLFIIANKLSGANGVIKANGGDGYRNTTNAGTTTNAGGIGALSLTSQVNSYSTDWTGNINTYQTSNGIYQLHPLGALMASIGGANGITTTAGGGIGTGGGSTTNGSASKSYLTYINLFLLARNGCLGGGGGTSSVNTTGTNNYAGGGGGGSVVVLYRSSTVTPTLQANGGTGATYSGTNNGGAGVTFYVQV